MDVAVQVFSFDEPASRLTATMDQYAACDVPSFVDSISYHACVTPTSAVVGRHPDAASDHAVFELVETPAGKLSSRNHAHDLAVGSGADVVVTGDTDAEPLIDQYLIRLLEPMHDQSTVAVNSNPIASGPTGMVVNALATVEDVVRPHMHGQGSAFTASGWQQAGPFDTAIDETDIRQVRAEEEFSFYRRLSAVGRVAYAPEARVQNDTRRVSCVIQSVRPGGPRADFCHRSGDTTFHPQDER